jgi:hypothetical protein
VTGRFDLSVEEFCRLAVESGGGAVVPEPRAVSARLESGRWRWLTADGALLPIRRRNRPEWDGRDESEISIEAWWSREGMR